MVGGIERVWLGVVVSNAETEVEKAWSKVVSDAGEVADNESGFELVVGGFVLEAGTGTGAEARAELVVEGFELEVGGSVLEVGTESGAESVVEGFELEVATEGTKLLMAKVMRLLMSRVGTGGVW